MGVKTHGVGWTDNMALGRQTDCIGYREGDQNGVLYLTRLPQRGYAMREQTAFLRQVGGSCACATISDARLERPDRSPRRRYSCKAALGTVHPERWRGRGCSFDTETPRASGHTYHSSSSHGRCDAPAWYPSSSDASGERTYDLPRSEVGAAPGRGVASDTWHTSSCSACILPWPRPTEPVPRAGRGLMLL